MRDEERRLLWAMADALAQLMRDAGHGDHARRIDERLDACCSGRLNPAPPLPPSSITEREVAALPLGLYRVIWRGGGESFAACGQDKSGRRWLAPVNWVDPATGGSGWWRLVERMEQLS